MHQNIIDPITTHLWSGRLEITYGFILGESNVARLLRTVISSKKF